MEVSVKIVGIIFSNSSTGFHAIRVSGLEGDVKTVTGAFPGVRLAPGLRVKFIGQYNTHQKYGERFHASQCEVMVEAGRDGVVKYLITNVPTIGPATAAKLYGEFGDDLPRILSEEPEKIRALKYLRAEQINSILDEWAIASESRTISIFLSNVGFTGNQIRRVISHFGVTGLVDRIKKDPYILDQCPGISFITADSVAMHLGLNRDSTERVCSMLLYAMKSLGDQEGHTWFTPNQIKQHVSEKLFFKSTLAAFTHGAYLLDSQYFQAIDELCSNGKIVAHGGKLYRAAQWKFESGSASCLSERLQEIPHAFEGLESILEDFERSKNIQLSDQQKAAIHQLQKSHLVVVTGYPGTGKTLLISAFVHLFEKFNLRYILVSPTGIAAKRLCQMTGTPASTIHRAMGFNGGTWMFNHSNRYGTDAVIVDECSMADSETFYRLVSALTSGTILVIVGDAEQLPSVGSGDVLRQLTMSPDIPNVKLTNIYRQEKLSDVVKVSHAMLRRESFDTTYRPESQVLFMDMSDDDALMQVCNLASFLKSKDLVFQVMAPMYKGDLGVDNLNAHLRQRMNPGYESLPFIDTMSGRMYEGDRVMMVKNNYDKSIFNGDTGKIVRINRRDNVVQVKIFDWFDQTTSVPTYSDYVFDFTMDEAQFNLRVAYACTVHRCVSPSTFVETNLGIQTIEDIAESGYIETAYGLKKYRNKVRNEESNMFRITTQDGYMIEVSEDHKMRIWDSTNGYVMKEAREVVEGDLTPMKLGTTCVRTDCVLVTTKVFDGHYNEKVYKVPTVVDEDFAEFLGLMVADGTIYEAGFRLKKSHVEVVERFRKLIFKLFEYEAWTVHGDIPGVEVNSRFLSRWLLSFGGMSPNDKHVPEPILKSPLSVQAAFLRGLFEDGTVNIESEKVDHIELGTIFPRLFHTVKVMLLRFGIISGAGYRKPKSENQSDFFMICLYGVSLVQFREQIGFISEFKQKRLFLEIGADTHRIVPVSKSEALSIRNANGGMKFFTSSDKNVVTRQRMSRRQLRSMLDRATVRNATWDELDDRLRFHHSSIRKIEKFSGPSLCVEVPDGHRFIQNGFDAGNSQGQEIPYIILPMSDRFRIMLYRNLVYTALTRAKNKAFVVGNVNAFVYASQNVKDNTRNSQLSFLIGEYLRDALNPPSTEVVGSEPEPEMELGF